MHRTQRRGFTLVELMVVIGILGLLVGILAVAIIPYLEKARRETEAIAFGKVVREFAVASGDRGARAKLKLMGEKAGRAFWNECFKSKILGTEHLQNIVSRSSKSPDDLADSAVFEEGGAGLAVNNCSYTSPKGSELLECLNLKGSQRAILFCHDSRNWANYGDAGVLVSWSEGEVPEYIDAAMGDSQFSIKRADWDNPARLFGTKKPFNRTHEEKK